jgi:hypothetical protein
MFVLISASVFIPAPIGDPHEQHEATGTRLN